MQYLKKILLEKHAENVLKRLGNWYTKTKASPTFKAKKMLGKTLLVGAPTAYGIDKLTEAPEPQRPR